MSLGEHFRKQSLTDIALDLRGTWDKDPVERRPIGQKNGRKIGHP